MLECLDSTVGLYPPRCSNDCIPLDCMCYRTKLLAILAGATGGAVAIAGMEAFSARAAFPLVAIPFATSIVTVLGSPRGRAGTATRPDRWPPRLYVRWAAHCQTLRPGTVGGGTCGRTGDGRNASDRDVSPAGGDRSTCGGCQQYVLGLPGRASRHWCDVARTVRLCLAQPARARGQQG